MNPLRLTHLEPARTASTTPFEKMDGSAKLKIAVGEATLLLVYLGIIDREPVANDHLYALLIEHGVDRLLNAAVSATLVAV